MKKNIKFKSMKVSTSTYAKILVAKKAIEAKTGDSALRPKLRISIADTVDLALRALHREISVSPESVKTKP